MVPPHPPSSSANSSSFSPMQLPFEEVESVEFARQGGGAVSSRTFDLVVRMKTDVEHQFRWVRAAWGAEVEEAAEGRSEFWWVGGNCGA